MRRGRIYIYLALVVVVILVVAVLFIKLRGGGSAATPQVTPTPLFSFVDIVTAGQNIYPGTPITEDMLNTMPMPADKLPEGLYTKKADVVGLYANYAISQNIPITTSMVSSTPGNVNLPGSTWSPFIPQGLTAVAIPITRLSSAAFGVRDGDYVDIIVSMLLVDIDSEFQSILPNYTAGVTEAISPQLTALIASGGAGSAQGRTELEPAFNNPLYIVPSEPQRPRLVTQMIGQNIQILHVGSFPLPGEPISGNLISPALGVTATPVPAGQQTTGTIQRPDIVTLMVTPQDAVTLTYLVYSGAQITLTLRNPNDQALAPQPEAGVLSYLLSQYNIPVPAKLSYGLFYPTVPRTDMLTQPSLPNDIITVPAQ